MKYSKFPYFFAIITGFILPLAAVIEPFPIPLILLCLVISGAFGFFWSQESWRWGLWIIGPSFALSVLSIAFAGQAEIFLKKDLLIFLIAILTVCLGSFVFSLVSISQTKKI